MGSRRSAASADAGFTLIELLVTMALLGILSATAVWGLRAYQHSQDESGSAHAVLSGLRNVAERAQSEGRTYCVSFDTATSWSIWRYSCQAGWTSGANTATQVATNQHLQGNSTITAISFAAGVSVGTCSAGSNRCAYFYPRGTASAGSLSIGRPGNPTVYTVHVEGLTGRAYLG